MAATLADQLASVQTAIAAIEGGAQSTTCDGQTVNRAELRTLYAREQRLLNRIDRESTGRITVAEF